MGDSKPFTQADGTQLKYELKESIVEIKESIVDIKHTINQRTNFIVWFVGVLIIGGFSVGFFFFYDKIHFMNEQYSDRFSRIETGLGVSSPKVLNLIDQIKKDYEKQKNQNTQNPNKALNVKPKKKK